MKIKVRNISSLCAAMTFVVIILSCGGSTGKNEKAMKAVPASDTASIHFREYVHDFGRISEGENVGCVFVFENRGVGPLVISSAATSCGCTIPKFDKRPIPTGETGTIEVVFDSSGRSGLQTKTITVTSNATKPVVLLRITGEVLTSNNN